MSQVLPVIHHLDKNTTLTEAQIAMDCGADGVFLISHHGKDMDLLRLGSEIKARHPSKFIGINMLAKNALEAFGLAAEFNFDGLWADDVGVTSMGVSNFGQALVQRMENRNRHQTLEVFGSVAFKYMAIDPNPPAAAQNALAIGMIPTTSGEGTGKAPTIEKIAAMSEAVAGRLAVASGMSCENIEVFAPYLSHILVSTLVSSDPYHFDHLKLERFVGLAHAAHSATA